MYTCVSTQQSYSSRRPQPKAENKAVAALDREGRHALANKIRNCSRTDSCWNVYCPHCRTRLAQRVERDTLLQFERFNGDEQKAEDQLRFITGLVALIPLNWHETRTALNLNIKDLRKTLTAFKRKFPKVWRRFVIELELIDLDGMKKSDCVKKRRTLFSMAGRSRGLLEFMDEEDSNTYGHYVLLHFHGVIDLMGCDDGHVREWFKEHFSQHAYQMKYDRTWKDQSLKEKAWKLSSYPFKDRMKYNFKFDTDGYVSAHSFSDYHLAEMVSLYDFISGRFGHGLIIGSKKSRRAL